MANDPWVQLKFRVRESLHRKIAESALENSVSLNAEIVTRLERSFGESGADPGVLRTELALVLRDIAEITNRLSTLMAQTLPPKGRSTPSLLDRIVESPEARAYLERKWGAQFPAGTNRAPKLKEQDQ